MGDHVPVQTVVSPNMITTLSRSKVAMQPWSHSKPMEIRDPDAREWKICVTQASGVAMTDVPYGLIEWCCHLVKMGQ